MVGMLILAMALILSLQAGRLARSIATQALEIQGAHMLLANLLATGPRSFQDAAGASGDFAWSLQTRVTGAEQPIAICLRKATLNNTRTHRTYGAETMETCPIQAQG